MIACEESFDCGVLSDTRFGNLVFSLLFLRDPLAGDPPGIGFVFGVLLVASSCLSLFAILSLALRRGIHATILGVSGSALSMGFYGMLASIGYSSLIRGQDGYAALWFLGTVGIVALNVVVLLFLGSITEKDQAPA